VSGARSALALGGALLLAAAVVLVVRAEPIGEARGPAPVVFVCRNGVAMSVWSAAYFNRLAAARGLRERASSRASVPSFAAVPFRMAVALALDGFRLDGYRPRVLSTGDVRRAELVVAIDTELPDVGRLEPARRERWEGFPPMRERYVPSRAALKARVEALVERLASRRTPSPS
jgi:protein-tyrosine-phosphatase